mmetsp:Transcript_101483/g.322487  ORF Transcript_101483/g.322487 Transcript_101483/m.322487 type:complete len:209 (-) Transcript_101483:147-773(-)
MNMPGLESLMWTLLSKNHLASPSSSPLVAPLGTSQFWFSASQGHMEAQDEPSSGTLRASRFTTPAPSFTTATIHRAALGIQNSLKDVLGVPSEAPAGATPSALRKDGRLFRKPADWYLAVTAPAEDPGRPAGSVTRSSAAGLGREKCMVGCGKKVWSRPQTDHSSTSHGQRGRCWLRAITPSGGLPTSPSFGVTTHIDPSTASSVNQR